MGSSGTYTLSFSNELKTYYRNYYDVKTTAEMAELTWIGANPGPNPGEPYTYKPLAQYSIGSDYILEGPFNGGRIYALVPWRWSQLSLTQKENLPPKWTTPYISPNVPGATPTWGVDYINYILDPSNSEDFSIASSLQNSGTTPAILSWPIPFGYIETNSGETNLGKKQTNNGDLSLINGNSLPLTIKANTYDNNNKGPASVTTGTSPSIQDGLWTALQGVNAPTPLPNPPYLPNNQQNVTFDWAQVDPADTALKSGEVQQYKGKQYNNLKAYLQHLANAQDKAFLYHDLRTAKNPVASVVASAYFYQDSSGDPYILVDGGSGNNTTGQYDTGLWLLPWNLKQLDNAGGGAVAQIFSSTVKPAAGPLGLESASSIYGNAGTAIFVNNKSLADITDPGKLKDVVAFLNKSNPSNSYTGNNYYAGDLFLGLTYGLIGSSEKLVSTIDFPTSTLSGIYPTDWGILSKSTPVGQLPSAWWYANGSYTPKITGSYIGPIANRQIGGKLWPSLISNDPYWNTYAVAIKNDKNLVLTNLQGEMEGTYGWPMDDRLGGNLVYFDNPAGNSLNIEIGAPYTPAKQVVSISSKTSTVNDSGDAFLVFEISRTETSSPLDVYYSIDTTEPSAAVFNKQYAIEGVTSPQMVKASFKSGENAIMINARPTPKTELVLGQAFVTLRLDKDKSDNYSRKQGSSSATGIITSNAPTEPISVSVSIHGSSQIPDSANQQLIYKITRSGDLSDSLSISLNLAGTAVSGVNYTDGSNLTPGNNTAVFEKGQPDLSYTIRPIDTNQISPLTVILSIDPASGYTVVQGKASATGTILGTTVFEQVGFKQVSDKPGLWTSSVASSEKGNLGLTAFVSEAKDGIPIAGQQFSLVDASGTSISGTQFSSSARQAGSLTQRFGQALFNAKSLFEFQSLAASSERRSIGSDNLKSIIAPTSEFAIKLASQESTQATVANSNGVYISSFANSTAISFSSGIFDLFGQTLPQNVQLQATAVTAYRNTLIAYRVDSITGAILQSGSWVKPGDAGYSQAALKNNLLNGDPLTLGFGESKIASFQEGTAKSADLFALAILTNGSISDYLTINPTNQKGNGPNMFFSIGAANPDGAAHMVSLDSGVVGFEDLWGGGDFDFNDVVVAFKNVPIVPNP